MADRWIVSAYDFVLQKTLAAAQSEAARLEEQYKKKKFRIYRVKTHVEPSGNVRDMVVAAQDLVALWKAQKISGGTRVERNKAIEEIRERLISTVDKMAKRDAEYAAHKTSQDDAA